MSRNAISLTLVVLFALVVGSFSASAQPPQPPKDWPIADLPANSDSHVYLPLVITKGTPVDTAVLAIQQEPSNLHPGIGSMLSQTIVLGAVFTGCMSQNEKAEWIALGCMQIPTLENGGAAFVGADTNRHLEITYQIKSGWRWTDGALVTAQDAVYWWWLRMQPDFPGDRSGLFVIYSVQAVDDQTILVKYLSEDQAVAASEGNLAPVVTVYGNVTFSLFLDNYASLFGNWQGLGPVVDPVYWSKIGWWPAHILQSIPPGEQAASAFATQPVGDGPYMVKQWLPGQEIILEKSQMTYPLGEPKIKTIIFRLFPSTDDLLVAMQNTEVDATTGVSGLTIANALDLDALAASRKYKISYLAGYAWEHLDLNTVIWPLDDVSVRKALYYGLDRQALSDAVWSGKAPITDLPVPKGLSWAYTDNYTKYPYNPSQAQALLAAAGWDCSSFPCKKDVGGEIKELAFVLATTTRTDRVAVAQAIQSQWQQLNVKVITQFYPGRTLFDPCSSGGPLDCRTFDVAMYTWITGDDPQLYGLYGCNAGQNYPSFCDPQAEEALLKSEFDPVISLSRNLRKPWLEIFFQRWTDLVPVIPLWNSTTVYAVVPGFRNWKPGPTANSPDTWNAWEWELYK